MAAHIDLDDGDRAGRALAAMGAAMAVRLAAVAARAIRVFEKAFMVCLLDDV